MHSTPFLLSLFALIPFVSSNFVPPHEVDPKATYAITIADHAEVVLDSKSGKLVVEVFKDMVPEDVKKDHGRRFQFPKGIIRNLDDFVNGNNTGIIYSVGGAGHGGYVLGSKFTTEVEPSTDHYDLEEDVHQQYFRAVEYKGGVRFMFRGNTRVWLEAPTISKGRKKVQGTTEHTTTFMLTKTTPKHPPLDTNFVAAKDINPEDTYVITLADDPSKILDSKGGKAVVETLTKSMVAADVEKDNGRRFKFPNGVITELRDITEGDEVGIINSVGAMGKKNGGFLAVKRDKDQAITHGKDSIMDTFVVAVQWEDGIRLMPRIDSRLWVVPKEDGKVKSSMEHTKWMVTKTTPKQ